MKKEKIVKFYSTYKLYIFPLMVILSSLFLIVFAIIPQTLKLLDNKKAIEELTNKSNFLETKASALENFDENDLSQKIKVAMGAFPEEKDFGNILGVLQQLAGQSGFTINSISFSNSGGKVGNASSYGVILEVEGIKDLFQVLLSNLENSPRLVRVEAIDIDSNSASQNLAVSLRIDVLYAQLPADFGSTDTPLPEISQKEEEVLATLASSIGSIVMPGDSGSQTPRGKANPFE